MTREARVHSERGARDSHAHRATADVDNKAGDVPHRTHTSRVSLAAFRSRVWKYWKKNGRHNLPWRKTKDPYRILLSEVMLQQTQVSRVSEKYQEFLEVYPTVRHLAKASLADVLKVWSGMGYNRRAKYLRDTAISIVENHRGRVPKDAAALSALLGIGPYTTSAIRVFAFDEPDVLIETNIRAVYIHHFHTVSQTNRIGDEAIVVVAKRMARGQDPRTWHYALMDYGVHIKKLHKNPARKSTNYVRQSKFEGSLRQIRGAILRELHRASPNLKTLSFEKRRIENALTTLARDGLITKKKGKWQIA